MAVVGPDTEGRHLSANRCAGLEVGITVFRVPVLSAM